MSLPLFTLSLRQAASPRRLLLLVLLAGLPILVDAVAGPGEDGIINGTLDALVIAAVLPIAVMALATAAFGNEIEDRTLSLLAMKPISRVAIPPPPVAATVLVAGSAVFGHPGGAAAGVAALRASVEGVSWTGGGA